MKYLKTILATKAALLVLGATAFYFKDKLGLAAKPVAIPTPSSASKMDAENDDTEDGSAEEPSADTPTNADTDIPDNIPISKAMRIKEQLDTTKRDVNRKIQQLAAAKRSYDSLKLDVEMKLKKVQEEKRVLDESLQQEKKVQAERLTEALEFIGKMDPRKAGPVLENMDKDLVNALISKLPPKQVTKILESVSPKKATELLEYHTKIRSGREYRILKDIGLCGAPDDQPK